MKLKLLDMGLFLYFNRNHRSMILYDESGDG